MRKPYDGDSVIVARNAQKTSRESALRALPRSGKQKARVYEFLVGQGLRGATDQEIEASLKIDGNTVRPTRGTLVKDGWVIDTGEVRMNHHGEKCIVWRSAELGMLL